MEVPDGVEPTLSELQSLALPLGYGTIAPNHYSKIKIVFQLISSEYNGSSRKEIGGENLLR